MSNNSQIMIPDEIVMQKIFRIKGKNVLLDQDLGELYDVKKKRLNEQVSGGKSVILFHLQEYL